MRVREGFCRKFNKKKIDFFFCLVEERMSRLPGHNVHEHVIRIVVEVAERMNF